MANGPDGYLVRVAREERDARRRERAESKEEDRRALDKLFEAHKHLSTLCATALVLVFAAGSVEVANVDVLLGMVAFGIPLIEALTGMTLSLYAARADGENRALMEKVATLEFSTGVFLFTSGVLFVVVVPSFVAQIQGG